MNETTNSLLSDSVSLFVCDCESRRIINRSILFESNKFITSRIINDLDELVVLQSVIYKVNSWSLSIIGIKSELPLIESLNAKLAFFSIKVGDGTQTWLNFISVCYNSCQKNRPSRHKPDGHLQSIETPHGVWQRLAMSNIGFVPQSWSDNNYFSLLTDLFSKFVVTKAVSDNTSTTASKFLLYDMFMKEWHFSPTKTNWMASVKSRTYVSRLSGPVEARNSFFRRNLHFYSITSIKTKIALFDRKSNSASKTTNCNLNTN
jgi:hypothetical protein